MLSKNKVIGIICNKLFYELVFVSLILTLGIIAFLILSKTHGNYQSNIFFYNKNDTFMDFLNFLKYVSLKDPYFSTFNAQSEKIYLPLSYILFYPFSKIFDFTTMSPFDVRNSQLGIMTVVIYLVFTSVAFAILLYEIKTGNKAIRFLSVIALFASGIYLSSLERANFIFLAAISVGFFIAFYNHENKYIRGLSILSLAFASVLKIYPVIFAVLLYRKKQYRELIWLVVIGLLLAFLPFFFFNGGLNNIPKLISNISENSRIYLLSHNPYRFGFSTISILLNLPKAGFLLISKFSLVLFILVGLTSWSLEKKWETVMLIACAIAVTPANSGFYCGLYLFVPIILFLNEEQHSFMDLLYLFLIIVALNPLQITKNSPLSSAVVSNFSVITLYLILLLRSIFLAIQKVNIRLRKNQDLI